VYERQLFICHILGDVIRSQLTCACHHVAQEDPGRYDLTDLAPEVGNQVVQLCVLDAQLLLAHGSTSCHYGNSPITQKVLRLVRRLQVNCPRMTWRNVANPEFTRKVYFEVAWTKPFGFPGGVKPETGTIRCEKSASGV